MSMYIWAIFCIFGSVSAQKVIIIGAGASGIATASRLLDHNFTDFIILEAENRVGGRINSFHLGDAVVDLGAEFIHGEKGNIAYSLAKDYVVHNPDGEDFAVFFAGKRKKWDSLENICRKLYHDLMNHTQESMLSLGEVYLQRFNATVFPKYKDDPEMTYFAKCLLKSIEAGILSLEGAFDWFTISSSSSFHEAEGDQLISWNGLGYKTIFDILLKNFPNKTGYNIDDKILLEKTVTRVKLKGDSVHVESKDGSHYTSEHVVFTPSIGVLRQNHKKLFRPELGEKKVEAIENLGFDGVMKIIMEFPEDWWHEEKNFLFVWNEEDIEDLQKSIRFGPEAVGDHWLTWFSYMSIASNNPRVMIGWYCGPFVKDVEKLSEKQMEEAVSYTMQRHLSGTYNVTKPKKVIHSNWCTNPNFLGTYSYETVKLRQKNITSAHHALSEPVKGQDGTPRILFAGEATSLERFSTVDGAIGSGFREGDRLVKILK